MLSTKFALTSIRIYKDGHASGRIKPNQVTDGLPWKKKRWGLSGSLLGIIQRPSFALSSIDLTRGSHAETNGLEIQKPSKSAAAAEIETTEPNFKE